MIDFFEDLWDIFGGILLFIVAIFKIIIIIALATFPCFIVAYTGHQAFYFLYVLHGVVCVIKAKEMW